MTAFAWLFTLAAVGIAETAYLIRKRIESEKPVCPIGGGCEIVLGSRYNKIFGVHNDILGFLFYMATAVLTGFLVIGVEPLVWWNTIVLAMVAGAAAMSLALIYLQWQVIKAWCFWCLMSAATIAGMALILSIRNFNLIS